MRLPWVAHRLLYDIQFSILECRRWVESEEVVWSLRKPPLSIDKIRGYPNGGR